MVFLKKKAAPAFAAILLSVSLAASFTPVCTAGAETRPDRFSVRENSSGTKPEVFREQKLSAEAEGEVIRERDDRTGDVDMEDGDPLTKDGTGAGSPVSEEGAEVSAEWDIGNDSGQTEERAAFTSPPADGSTNVPAEEAKEEGSLSAEEGTENTGRREEEDREDSSSLPEDIETVKNSSAGTEDTAEDADAGSGQAGDEAADPSLPAEETGESSLPGAEGTEEGRRAGAEGTEEAPRAGAEATEEGRQDGGEAPLSEGPEGTEAGSLPQPEAPEDLLLTEDGNSESVSPAGDGSADPDNDDLFAAYVNRELGLTGDLRMDSGDAEVSTPRKNRNYASNSLSGYNLTAYALLLRQIREVAAGDRTDTVFTVTLEEMGLDGRSWSAADLGVDALVVDRAIAADAKSAMNALLAISFKRINRALLADCPFDLYWYDKTSSATSRGFGLAARWSEEEGEYRLFFTGAYTFSFPVSADYAVSQKAGTFEADPEIGASVRTACETAHTIVDRYADRTDYEKLDAYRREICDLTSYNRKAANDKSTPYGDPWQLIWVFDGDPDTTVVCEGYSKGFQYLCDLSEFHDIFRECLSVTGTLSGISGPGGHMWNIIALRDGRSYLADLTNCDQGTIGAENGLPGRKLFLVGTGETTGAAVFAAGGLEEGYSFAGLSGLSYAYDEYTRTHFDDAILTLAPGRVDASTTAEGAYDGDHAHIYLPVEEEAADCLHEGHSAFGQCVVCGARDENYVLYPLADHTPGDWTVTEEPTYDAEGMETAACTVCGIFLTRPVEKLVPVTDITLNKTRTDLPCGQSEVLTAVPLPENASDRSVIWTSSDPAVASVDAEGRVKAGIYGTATITAAAAGGIQRQCTVQTRFKDVSSPARFYYTPVYWAVDRGITRVTSSFRPEDPVTRGELVAFLWRMAGCPASTVKVSFRDVDSRTKFYQAIRWSVGRGIIRGYSDGTFRSDRLVTRGETATMLWRNAGCPAPKTSKSPFSDIKATGTDSCRAILWGSENNIIKGSGGKFLKNGLCTRGQTVTFLYRWQGEH